MDYLALKHLHMTFAAVSGLLFLWRGCLMLGSSPDLHARWLRVVPHVNDTLLLVAGIGLAIASRQSPHDHPWLAAKIVALLVYIGLGMVALRFGRTRRTRLIAWLLALGLLGYIVAVAVTRRVVPFA